MTGKLLLTILIALLPSFCLHAQEKQMTSAASALHQLVTAEWDYEMEQNPTRASWLGDRRWNDRWQDVSLDAINKRHQHNVAVLAKLKAIDRSALSPKEQLNYDLFLNRYEIRIEGYQYRGFLIPLNQRSGIQTVNELADALRFQTVKDYEDWLARLRKFPSYMEQTMALMRQGIQERILLPKIVMQRVSAQIEHQIVRDPETSPFYKPFLSFPNTISESERSRLTQGAKEAVSSSIVPAFSRFKKFFLEEYLPACLDHVGVWQLNDGDARYRFLIRLHTDNPLDPKEIHETGLAEVKRIRAEMQGIIDSLGFKGTFLEFLHYLRTDSRFYYKGPDELLEAYRALTRRIDPKLVTLFKNLPRAPYGVEPIPDNIAPDTTTAYYRSPAGDGSRAGTYFVNIYRPEARPKYEMMVLSLHEAVPGHHLQIAVAMEQRDLPNFRRYGGYTAFIEGWGLYAELLGDEMALYDDPYSKFGQLTYEMWRAVRLVVDTGIHHFRWDRQKAVDFFLENTAKAELDVVNEVDRYIAWPGQALAYKIGQLKISAIRSNAQKTLGSRFDIRAFHDELLKDGALPLNILEAKMDAWVASQLR
jgi:uncharacterized protein (DUF885 family)